MDKINSPIFGETRNATDSEKKKIKKFVDDTPVTVFQELGKKMNSLGFTLSIGTIEDVN